MRGIATHTETVATGRPAPDRDRHRRTGFAAIAIVAMCCFGLLAWNNLRDTSIWWDEVAQFLISHGVSQFSDIGAAGKGLADVFAMNRFANLDPGGYSVFLHYWMMFSDELPWLRLSAYLFLLLTAVGVACLGWAWTRSAAVAGWSLLLPLAFGTVLFHGFEIRAYSMEILGVVTATVLLDNVLRSPSSRNALLLGLGCAVFMTSRYSYAITASAVVFTYLVVAVASPTRARSALLRGVPAILWPMAISAFVIYKASLKAHLLDTKMGSLSSGMFAPGYVKGAVLKGRSSAETVQLYIDNLFSWQALPITLCIAGLLLVRPLLRRYRARVTRPGPTDRDLTPFYFLILTAQTGSCALSALGLYPWDIRTRWSAYLTGFSLVACVVLAAEAWRLLGNAGARPLGGRKMAAIALACAIAVAAVARAATYHRSYPVDLGPALAHLAPIPLGRGSVYVAMYEAQALRYLYEYGPFKGSAHYPAAFRFEARADWEARNPIPLDRDCIRYVISAQFPVELAPRLVGGKLEPLDSGTKWIYRVVPTGGTPPATCPEGAAAAS